MARKGSRNRRGEVRLRVIGLPSGQCTGASPGTGWVTIAFTGNLDGQPLAAEEVGPPTLAQFGRVNS